MSTEMKILALSLVLTVTIIICGASLNEFTAQSITEAAPVSMPDTVVAEKYASTHKPIEQLGRFLFWDPVLSGDQDTACATCHHPDFAYTDGRELSRGTGAVGLGPDRIDNSDGIIPDVRRNAPTVLNTALNGMGSFSGQGGAQLNPRRMNTGPQAPMFWDHRVRSLALQALEPIKVFEEMRGPSYSVEEILDVLVSRLAVIPQYRILFEEAFGEGSEITAFRIGEAIAAFEKTLIAMNSPVDKFLAGDRAALSAQQQRGMKTFENKRCNSCHGGVMFSDYTLHTEGVAEHPRLLSADAGAGSFDFRSPTLRNIALTAPYMHNGTLATLEDVMDFYNEGESRNPNVAVAGDGLNAGGLSRLDASFTDVPQMSDEEMADIIAFMRALTDTEFDKSIPAFVPSGLTPGGSIHGNKPEVR